MVYTKIDLAGKRVEDVMALAADLSHYAHIISVDKEITEYRKEVGLTDRNENNTKYAIESFNKAIIKYCEGNYTNTLNDEKDEWL